ncbi:MAG: AMP-binding protein [Candidatus Acidiferrales bacterium]
MARKSLIEYLPEYARRGNEPAVASFRGYRVERWTYGRIADEASRLARELESRGIGRGDAVLLWAENSAEWLAVFWGCLLRGAVVVPIDHISTADFAVRVAQQVNPKLLVCSQAAAAGNISIPILTIESLCATIAQHSPAPYDSLQLSRKDVLEIVFTSGTMAEPRGVVISHGNVLANIEPIEREIRKYLRYERIFHPLRFLNMLPLSHVFGQMLGIFIPPILGATTIFSESLNPADLVQTIRRERASVLVAVPRLIESMEKEIERGLERDGQLEKFRIQFAAAEGQHFLRRWWWFRRIRRRLGWKFWAFISGGAALPAAVESFWNRLGYAVIQGYGMTETTALISLNHPFRLGKGSIGKLFPGLEMKVSPEGEILVRGENIATAYRRGMQMEPVVGADGWFHTGDLAEVGAEDRLYFKGRKKNVIVTPAGMNIYPEDLERALREQPGVKDVIVVGIELDGNAEPCAVLLLDDSSMDPAPMVAEANKKLADFQRVRRWIVWPDPDFPRTPTQKPIVPRIRAAVEAKFGGKSAPVGAGALTDMIARIKGMAPESLPGSAALEQHLNMSSLDRVELMSALEERYQVDLSEVKFSDATTIGELEEVLRNPPKAPVELKYPRWPQSWLTTAIRNIVYYLAVWPATYILAAPRVRGRQNLRGISGPVLFVSNHVTYVDIGWVLAALPGHFRHRLATAMQGERIVTMLRPPPEMNILERWSERLSYYLVFALFNVFPLPKESGFRRSFSFAGDLADRGWNILIFPEGQTSKDGRIAPFRSGIGLLAQSLHIPVVPIRLDGLFELKRANRIMAGPGKVQVTIGQPVRFSPEQEAGEIARELARRMAEL